MDLLGSTPELLGGHFRNGATANGAFCADQDRGADGSTSAVSRAWPSPEKSSKKVAAKLFILQGGAKPLPSVPVWAELSQSLVGM
jgi:hypothetical protein